MENRQLPKDWKWVKLGEVLTVSSGKGIKVNSLQGGKYSVYGGNGLNGYHSEYFIEEPKLIIGRVGVKCGVTHITKSKSWVTDNALIVEPKNDAFDIQFLKLKLGFENLNKLSVSTAQPVISGSKIYAYEILLPPKSTQLAIISKIEELFSELEKGIESLFTAKQQLKTYRQSVLKWAFEGKLTNENVKDGELPKAWKWKQIKEIASLLGDGLHGTPKYTIDGEYHFINGNNLSDGKIIFKDSTKRVDFEEYQKHKKNLTDSTILVSINGTLGNTAFYNSEKVILGKSACYFNLNNEADKHFVRYILVSQRFLNYATNTATGSTIPNVSLKAMKDFEIPLPPIEEQVNIVQAIESRLSVADKMEESITQSLQQAETLKQSILKKGFEGELV